MKKIIIVATGADHLFDTSGPYYRALNYSVDIGQEKSEAPRKYLTCRPAPDVMARNYAMKGWQIGDLEAQASELDALINPQYQPINGRPARHYILLVSIGENDTDEAPKTVCARIRAFLQARQAAGWHPLICTLPTDAKGDVGIHHQTMNGIMRKWGKRDGVYGVVDHETDTSTMDRRSKSALNTLINSLGGGTPL